MSLNDEQMSDLEKEQAALAAGDQSDIDIPPVVVVDVPDEDTGNQIEEQKIEEEMLKEQVALKQLDDADTKVALVNNQSVKVQDLMDVSNLVLGAESIDQATADQVNVVTGDFYNNSGIIREEFTNLPTRTNLSETKGYVTKRTKEETEELHKLFMDLFNNEMACLFNLRKLLQTKAFPRLLELIRDVEHAMAFMLPEIGNSKKFIFSFPIRKNDGKIVEWTDPVNFVHAALCRFTYRNTESKFCNDITITAAIIEKALEVREFLSLLSVDVSGNETQNRTADIFSRHFSTYRTEVKRADIVNFQTPMQIFAFTAAGGFTRMVERLCTGLNVLEEYFENPERSFGETDDEHRKAVVTSSNAQDYINGIRYTYQVYLSLVAVIPAIHKLFSLFEAQLNSPEIK